MLGIFHDSADVFVLKVCLFSFFFHSDVFSLPFFLNNLDLFLFSTVQKKKKKKTGHREARPQARRGPPGRQGGPPGPGRRGPRPLREDRDLQLLLVLLLFLSSFFRLVSGPPRRQRKREGEGEKLNLVFSLLSLSLSLFPPTPRKKTGPSLPRLPPSSAPTSLASRRSSPPRAQRPLRRRSKAPQPPRPARAAPPRPSAPRPCSS